MTAGRAMVTEESLIEYVWKRVGAECREHVRESLDLIERLGPEDRPKALACFYWANWLRGRRDFSEGREKFWDKF